MRQDRAAYAYERPQKAPKEKTFGRSEVLVVCLFAGLFSPFRDNGYWTIAVFGVDSRQSGKGALSDVENVQPASTRKPVRSDWCLYSRQLPRISDKDNYDKINEALFPGWS